MDKLRNYFLVWKEKICAATKKTSKVKKYISLILVVKLWTPYISYLEGD